MQGNKVCFSDQIFIHPDGTDVASDDRDTALA